MDTRGALTLSSAGSYPRAGGVPGLQAALHTVAAAARGERTAADLAGAENELTCWAIEQQARAGIELLTDGLVRGHDPVSHFPTKLAGVALGDSLPVPGTASQFRQLILKHRPVRNGTSPLAGEYRFACNALGRLPASAVRAGKVSLKPVLTGPYTLAQHSRSDDAALQLLEARAMAWAEALADEVQSLADAGAEFIQVDEPAILDHAGDWELFCRALDCAIAPARGNVAKGKAARVALYTWWGDAAPLYEKLVQLPVDVVGLDFTSSATLADRVVAAGSPVPLALGVVDGRNAQFEDPDAIARLVEKLLPKIPGGRVWLGPSCGLDSLPHAAAFAKLELLTQIRAAVTVETRSQK